MSVIIGLSGIRPSGPDMVYLQVKELENETIFSLDRLLRGVVKKNPRAEWASFIDALEREGFSSTAPTPESTVFIHSRPWDEHLVCYGQSFLVAFPADAPYELARHVLLASPYPSLYASISTDYMGQNKVVLLNAEHEPVYHDDLAWTSEDQRDKRVIGPVILMKAQFIDDIDYLEAKNSLLYSGYSVLDQNN